MIEILLAYLLGVLLGWVLFNDSGAERGKHVVPESIEYRTYWVHDGRRFYAGELDDPAVPPLPLVEPSPSPLGRWSVEDGQPFWVCAETGTHWHPVSLIGADKAAWSALALIIWDHLESRKP